MAGSTFSTHFKITTWGESHGRGIGVVVDGCPAGLPLCEEDIQKLLETVDEESREVFLVLSATTKYNDLVKIALTYAEITKYTLIFTKLDETDTVGNIFNIHMLTGAPLSYTTWGQNVPDDIGEIDPQKVAKQLLGGNRVN